MVIRLACLELGNQPYGYGKVLGLYSCLNHGDIEDLSLCPAASHLHKVMFQREHYLEHLREHYLEHLIFDF